MIMVFCSVMIRKGHSSLIPHWVNDHGLAIGVKLVGVCPIFLCELLSKSRISALVAVSLFYCRPIVT